jgi:hypothetical protein
MVFNTTFNNILAISWPSALLVGETGEKNYRLKDPKCKAQKISI